MEKTPLVEELLKINEDFKKLWDEHEELNRVVDEMSEKVYLTPEEEVKLKELKLKKLKGKEKLVEMIEQYKKEKESS
jgi:uncharacterized protein YdcH (DUF465 family)